MDVSLADVAKRKRISKINARLPLTQVEDVAGIDYVKDAGYQELSRPKRSNSRPNPLIRSGDKGRRRSTCSRSKTKPT